MTLYWRPVEWRNLVTISAFYFTLERSHDLILHPHNQRVAMMNNLFLGPGSPLHVQSTKNQSISAIVHSV